MAQPQAGAPQAHAGLQRLAALAQRGAGFLGPAKAAKFVAGPGGSAALAGSAARLLDGLEAPCGAGQLLHEAALAQRAAYGTGAGTLAFLAGAWGAAALRCLAQGVPGPVLAAGLARGLEACRGQLGALHVPLRPGLLAGPPAAALPSPLLPVLPSPLVPAGPPLPAGPALPAPGAPRGLSHSRHFHRPEPRAEAAATQSCGDLAQLAAGLSHGDPGSMALAVAAARCQQQSPEPLAFDVSRVCACCVPGLPESCSCVLAGYVALLPGHCAPTVRELQGRPVRVALIDGDLRESYRHAGYEEPGRVMTRVCGAAPSPGPQPPWPDRTLGTLRRLGVSLVLVRGGVCQRLAESCVGAGVLLVSPVGSAVLREFARATRAQPVTYATQLDEQCVGAGVSVSPWQVVADRVAVLMTAPGVLLATAVLTGPAPAHMQAREDRFWGCAHRLAHALLDQRVFLGGGAVEILCLAHLHRLMERSEEEEEEEGGPAGPSWMAASQALYRPAVLKALAEGWHKYLSAVVYNTGTCSSEREASTRVQNFLQKTIDSGCPVLYLLKEYNKGSGETSHSGAPGRPKAIPRVYDVVTPKIEAWRRALDLVLLVLQTDAEIITGAEYTQLSSQESNELLLL